MAQNLKTPFHYDFVGSFLRPEELKNARAQFLAGKVTQEALTEVEDRAILDLIAKQKKAGYHVLTDGEFRRATWHLDFMWAFEGVSHAPSKFGLPFEGEAAMIDDTWVSGKLSYVGHHPFLQHVACVLAQEVANSVRKATLPAPAQFLEQVAMPFALEQTRKVYSTDEELIADIVTIYKAFIADLYAVGCRNLQLDDCSWGLLVDPRWQELFGTDDAGIDRIRQQ